ncbi:hypothetical protein K438DRAFT_584529 [Mycena galopus ATCC 62051]|nr:hypothetical protein K438DRAFT_584529 [Mycena galopus ATCC 62051]
MKEPRGRTALRRLKTCLLGGSVSKSVSPDIVCHGSPSRLWYSIAGNMGKVRGTPTLVGRHPLFVVCRTGSGASHRYRARQTSRFVSLNDFPHLDDQIIRFLRAVTQFPVNGNIRALFVPSSSWNTQRGTSTLPDVCLSSLLDPEFSTSDTYLARILWLRFALTDVFPLSRVTTGAPFPIEGLIMIENKARQIAHLRSPGRGRLGLWSSGRGQAEKTDGDDYLPD